MTSFLPPISPATGDVEFGKARAKTQAAADIFLQPSFKDTFASQRSVNEVKATADKVRTADAGNRETRKPQEQVPSRQRYQKDEKREPRATSAHETQDRQEEKVAVSSAQQHDSAQSAETDSRQSDQRDQAATHNQREPQGGSAEVRLPPADDIDGQQASENAEELTAMPVAPLRHAALESSISPSSNPLADGAFSLTSSTTHATGFATPLTVTATQIPADAAAIEASTTFSALTRTQTPTTTVETPTLKVQTPTAGLTQGITQTPTTITAGSGLFTSLNASLSALPAGTESPEKFALSEAVSSEGNSGSGASKPQSQSPALLQLQGNLRSAPLMQSLGPLRGENLKAGFEAQLAAAGISLEDGAGKSSLSAAPGLSNLSGLGQVHASQRVQMPVNISFGQSAWSEVVAQRSAMMAAQSIKFAELQLDPPELGQLQVRVQVHHDQASISFSAPNAQVKEALDQTVARLRELLEEQGLNLADVDVSDQSSSQSQDDDGLAKSQDRHKLATESSEEGDAPKAQTVNVGYGIDHYA